MRKFFLLILLFAMLAALTGCGDTPAAEQTEPVAVSESPAAPSAAPSILPERPAEPETEIDETIGEGAVYISEIMAKNHSTLRSADGGFYDWVEIENASDETFELEGWQLSDRENKEGWLFPSVSIAPQERLVIFASKGQDVPGELHAGFGISEGETIWLRNASGHLLSCVSVDCAVADSSLRLGEDGHYYETVYPTPGCSNTAHGFEKWQNAMPVPDGLVINEAMVDNFSYLPQADGNCYDWVELKNLSSETIDLSDYYLSDDEDDLYAWRLPDTRLAPGKTAVIICSGDAEFSYTNNIIAPFRLSSQQEQLFLTGTDGEIEDYISLHGIPFGCTYGRMDGEGGWFYFEKPTPGSNNGSGCRRVSASPACLTNEGVYENTESVTVELSAEGEIYYALSTDKKKTFSLYTDPITVSKTTVITAYAQEDGALPSPKAYFSFIMNENLTLPVVSLAAEKYDDFLHIYNGGRKDIEIPGNMAFFEDGGSFSIGCGIKMNGMTSLNLYKKNLSLRFRGGYGQESLDYDVFGGGVTNFTNFVLRAGQDYYSAILRNELCQELCLAMGDSVITQRSRYCILFVNGNYYGIYALKEKTNEQLYASISGTDKESVTVDEAKLPPSAAFYQEVWSFCMENDMTKAENYEHFCEIMDVDSLIDWIIIEGYCANDDMTSGNVRYTRSTQNDGKWRMVFYDLDSTLVNPNKNFYNVFPYGISFVPQFSEMLYQLIKNEDFVDRLLTRAGYHLNHALTNENAVATLERLAKEIDAEVERDIKRIDNTKRGWNNNIDFLRNFFLKNDWRQHNIDTLSKLFHLTEAEKDKYFSPQITLPTLG